MPTALNRHGQRALVALVLFGLAQACALKLPEPGLFDILIVNGNVYDGSLSAPQAVVVGIRGERIAYVGEVNPGHRADQIIDASGWIVAPGFIDPHTHSLADLQNSETRHNLNYLTQGVTTVIVGNDGGGDPEIATLSAQLTHNGIGTNVGFLVGHGNIRRAVFGEQNRPPTVDEIRTMRAKVRDAMEQGALGLSSGLYYTPGAFADTTELIDLAKVVANYGGIYDTHIRDESTYSIGLAAAVAEAIEIGRASGVPVNISHIKALGVDVWGESLAVSQQIESARQQGLAVTADQYPWRASGTSLKAALIPKALTAQGGSYPAILDDYAGQAEFDSTVAENLRRRGGPDSIFLTAAMDLSLVGRTLAEVAEQRGQSFVDAAVAIERAGGARIASFNMHDDDIVRFMTRDWVMTSSDGSTGHPRKFATYPMKFQKFVAQSATLTVDEFVHRSSTLIADTFNLSDRGRLEVGAYADVVLFNPERFKPIATFAEPALLSTGVEFLFVNGTLVIANGEYLNECAGRPLTRNDCHQDQSCGRTGVPK